MNAEKYIDGLDPPMKEISMEISTPDEVGRAKVEKYLKQAMERKHET